MELKTIEGGITAPRGFRAGGVRAGIKKGRTKRDLALIVSDTEAAAAAVYTTNLVKGAPILVTQEHLRDGRARAVIVNSGIANTCNGEAGVADARRMCALAAGALGIRAEDVVVASTGVIGQRLPMDVIESALPALAADLSEEGGERALEAIMTTDTRPKQAAVEFSLGGRTVRIGAMAKGSGMICPNMATMLAFACTDCAVSPEALRALVKESADRSFNCVSVDGDTSTNDMLCVMANGRAGNSEIVPGGPGYAEFAEALDTVNRRLAREIARDGEGATRLIECSVEGADDDGSARALARSVVSSSLVKAAFFGADANWGRILCAMGYAGPVFDPSEVSVSFSSAAGEVLVCRGGAGTDFDEDLAKRVLLEKEIGLHIRVGSGPGRSTAWGCDLTYDYVKINGDYRS
jgi:glutamate N-acetyltransferase/amino-acid N-acetyltransferase